MDEQPEIQSFSRALVIGDGLSAVMASNALLDLGIEVTRLNVPSQGSAIYSPLAGMTPDRVRAPGGPATAMSKAVDWSPGTWLRRDSHAFELLLPNGRSEQYGCIFLAGSQTQGIKPPGLPDQVRVFEPDTVSPSAARTVYLLDLSNATPPSVGMAVVAAAMENTIAGGESWVLIRNAPVRHVFGEELYQSAKRQGVVFLRFGDELPTVQPEHANAPGDGAWRVSVTDVIEAGEQITIHCDEVLVAPDLPSSGLSAQTRDVAGLNEHAESLLLSSSIHCHSGGSFIDGVFCVGEPTGEHDIMSVRQQAAAAAAHARSWLLRLSQPAHGRPVSVDDGCVRCLTCGRICPHAAVSVIGGPSRSRIEMLGASCRECGVCVSECPREALDLLSIPRAEWTAFFETVKKESATAPVGVVYGCRRSPQTASAGIEFPAGLLTRFVPCAGLVSERLIWETLNAGAAGVLVLSCHHGNCASATGSQWAEQRVNAVKEALALTCQTSVPLVVHASVSSLESARLEGIVRHFCELVHSDKPRPGICANS